jgi:TonB family protein
MLLAGLARLSAVAARARRITTGTWFDRCEQVRREYGIRRTLTLMQSPGPALLVTWGILRPKLMVPAAALGWSDSRVRSVLYHELAHVRRGDWIVQLVADLLRSIFWFNPLVWFACARLRSEGEQACDDAVLNRGIDGAAYALDLVDIARDLKRPRRWAPGAAIAHTSNLERRIRAMLDTRLNRRPVSRSVRLATLLGLLTIAVPLGALAAFQTSFSTLSGSIVDPLNGALPAATVVVTNENSQAKYEVQSDRTGRYEVGGLPPGDYWLEVRLPGFATLKQKLTVTGQSIERNMVLQVGSVQETIVVSGGGSPATGTSPAPRRERVERPCGAQPAAEGVPIGGNLRPPAKLRDVRPDYPAALREAGVEGTIVLRGRLGSDGFLHDLTPQPASDARLAQAAIDAAAQWEFAPTLLNCVAIDIPITITVTFRR